MNLFKQIIAAVAAAAIVAAIGWTYAKYLFRFQEEVPQKAQVRAKIAIVVLTILSIIGTYKVVVTSVLTPQGTPTSMSTHTHTPTPTGTLTSTPSPTNTPTHTPTPTSTSTPMPTSSNTSTPLPTSTPTFTPTPRSLCYEFEFGEMGWEPEEGNQAIRRVARSTEWVRSGKGSLELEVELDGGDKNLAQGVAFVDLRYNPPPGLKAPLASLDLEGVSVTMWVFALPETAGDPAIPNGVQVFAKDQDFKTESGQWRDLTTRDDNEGWIAVTLTPSTDPPKGVVMDPGFDPSRIVLIGIKIAVGEGSTATFKNSIWIDEVCWQMP